jgi:hypothetical protein
LIDSTLERRLILCPTQQFPPKPALCRPTIQAAARLAASRWAEPAYREWWRAVLLAKLDGRKLPAAPQPSLFD